MDTIDPMARQVSPNKSTLPHPKLQAIADYWSNTVSIAMERVVAHHVEPAKYPLPQDMKSLEQILERLFEKRSKEKQDAIVAQMLPRIRASKEERAAQLGNLALIDLSSAKSVVEQVKALPFPTNLKITQQELPQVLDAVTKIYPALRSHPPIGPSSVPPATKLDFRLQKVHCTQTTRFELGADEISLALITVDNLGTVSSPFPRDLGKFRQSQDRVVPDELLLTFDLTKGTFAKAFAVVLTLIETDFQDLADRLKTDFGMVAMGSFSLLLAGIPGNVPLVVVGAIGLLLAAGMLALSAIGQDEFLGSEAFPIVIESNSLALPAGASQVFTFAGSGGSYLVTVDYKPAA